MCVARQWLSSHHIIAAQKTPLPTVLLLRVCLLQQSCDVLLNHLPATGVYVELFHSNGCFYDTTVFASSKHAVIHMYGILEMTPSDMF
jgi:hypothetical protein